MQIVIEDFKGNTAIVELADVGPVYQADDAIYFNGVAYKLSTARPMPCDL